MQSQGRENTAPEEGPAVLRLRMLEMRHDLRLRPLEASARRDADAALEALRRAILERPHLSFVDLVAKLRTGAGVVVPADTSLAA